MSFLWWRKLWKCRFYDIDNHVNVESIPMTLMSMSSVDSSSKTHDIVDCRYFLIYGDIISMSFYILQLRLLSWFHRGNEHDNVDSMMVRITLMWNRINAASKPSLLWFSDDNFLVYESFFFLFIVILGSTLKFFCSCDDRHIVTSMTVTIMTLLHIWLWQSWH